MTTRAVHWRETVAPAELREFDAFGPWIYPVRSASEMPWRFREHYAQLGGAELMLKIPRDLDRADIQPGDDLYRSVLAVFGDRLCLLHAGPPGSGPVERTDVGLSEVVGFSASENLLQGTWTLMLRNGGKLVISHPATSADVMAKVSNVIRPRITGIARRMPEMPPIRPTDHLFTGRLNALAREFGTAVPLHVDPRNVACRTGRGWPKLSNGTMIVFTSTELVIISRGEAARPVFQPNYAVVTVELPYQRLESFAVRPPEKSSSFHQLVLRSGMQEYVQPCLHAPDAVEAHLRRLELIELV